MKIILISISLLLCSSVSAEQNLSHFLGVMPGSVLQTHGKKYLRGPYLVSRIPTRHSALAAEFHDLEVLYESKTNRIVAVEARRAYFSKFECLAAEKKIIKHLSEYIPVNLARQGKNMQITARVICHSGTDYPTLIFSITYDQAKTDVFPRLRSR